MSAPVKVALLGAAGRMGQAVLEAATSHADIKVMAALVRSGSEMVGWESHGLPYSDDLAAALKGADVLLDFSLPSSTLIALEACLTAGKPLVTGVTGLDAAAKARLAAAGKRIPVLVAPNMSYGVALLTRLVKQAATVLGEDFDVEIAEAHHRHKKDAPSGTALALAEAVSGARGVPAPTAEEARSGIRKPGSIGFAVQRGGDIVGEHSVLFAGAGEQLELTHRAQSRSTFAHGALRAAGWIAGRPAGSYSLADTLVD